MKASFKRNPALLCELKTGRDHAVTVDRSRLVQASLVPVHRPAAQLIVQPVPTSSLEVSS